MKSSKCQNGVKNYFNESLCPYYKILWAKYKKLWLTKEFCPFGSVMGHNHHILHLQLSKTIMIET